MNTKKIIGIAQLTIGIIFLAAWFFIPVDGPRYSAAAWMELLLSVFLIITAIPNLKKK
jgi:hypothetical protein